MVSRRRATAFQKWDKAKPGESQQSVEARKTNHRVRQPPAKTTKARRVKHLSVPPYGGRRFNKRKRKEIMSAVRLLEELTEKYAQRDLLNIEKKRAVPLEVQKILDDIEIEFSPKSEHLNDEISAIESAVKKAVVADGTTAKGGSLQAVFSKGRVSWDSKALDGYSKAHPEIAEYRKEGEPSVSIRKVS